MAKGRNRLKILEEGKEYDFRIGKLVKLSDNENYFILIDPFNNKRLMFDRIFVRYGMKTGDVIKCKVDKINCNGKIYLEPRHPYYRTGQKYEFEFIAIEEVENSKKVKEKVLCVDDTFKSKAVILDTDPVLYENFLKGKIIAKVENIKKARLYLGILK